MNKAFTLVELLVVSAIIAVLLAMLVPALEKAIYQAELATCAGKLKVLASTSAIYALDHKRYYPHRSGLFPNDDGVNWWAEQIRDPRDGLHDDRPELRPYLGINAVLNCPLSKAVDLTRDGTSGGAFIFSNYELYMGWRYRESTESPRPAGRAGPGPGMIKLGDRWETDPGNNTRRYRMSLVAADLEYVSFFHNNTRSSHPDKAGVLLPLYYQNFGDPGNAGSNTDTGEGRNSAALEAAVPAGGIQQYNYANANVTVSYWHGEGADWSITNQESKTWARGPVDRNFGYADGAVLRLNHIVIRLNTADDRMIFTAQGATAAGAAQRKHLPKP